MPWVSSPRRSARRRKRGKLSRPQNIRARRTIRLLTLPHLQLRSIPSGEALPLLNDATMVIAMLESASRLDGVEAIAATVGIDVLLIGSNDLTADLGIPGQYDNKRAVDAYYRIIDACLDNG